MSFFNQIKSGFDSFANFVRKGFSDVTSTVGNGIGKVFESGEKLANKIVDGGFKFLNGQTQIIAKAIDKGGDVLMRGETVLGGTVSNVASSLSMPLLIGAGILGGFLLIRK